MGPGLALWWCEVTDVSNVHICKRLIALDTGIWSRVLDVHLIKQASAVQKKVVHGIFRGSQCS